MLWQDEHTGFWHAILHNLEGPHMCYNQLCQVGIHAFSRDGNHWTNGGTAYTNLVDFTDGTRLLLNRRERPHVVFAKGTTVPIALSNSAEPGGASGEGGRVPTGGDLSFTLVQAIKLRRT